jgi:GNAT superfamily N-acetyltransferase
LDGNSALIGHARLCPLPSQQSALWVESIVIWKRLRGLGIGRILMQQIEEWSRERGFKQVYFSLFRSVFLGFDQFLCIKFD